MEEGKIGNCNGMLNNDKDLKQEKSILFLKWLSIFLFSLYVLLDLGIYQKAITNFHYLVLVIIFVVIASEKFDEIKIGNIIELKKIKKEFNEKTDKILSEIRQIQSQKQGQGQNQGQNQSQKQKQSLIEHVDNFNLIYDDGNTSAINNEFLNNLINKNNYKTHDQPPPPKN